MERKLTAKGEATRGRIVAAAAGLMYERGVAGTSTEDVLAAAGVRSPSQLYHYFGDKRALVQAVIQYQTEFVLSFQKPLLSRLDSFEALEAWRDAVVERQAARNCEGGCPIGSLAGELADRDTRARGELAETFGQWEQAIRDGLASLQDRGELDPAADVDELALVLLTALQGGLLMTQVRRDTTALHAVLTATIDYLRGFGLMPAA
ncbi:TetR/AcrR family transcriptional regulator [Kribbella sp. NPDC051770]|uniref:TetR/AcrR family transcriptional regulator n=1 Tax=Kribbella sp. NPDC051770 TaxID=3155413 RepID=UPI0034263457